jgi:hypothetical protein
MRERNVVLVVLSRENGQSCYESRKYDMKSCECYAN